MKSLIHNILLKLSLSRPYSIVNIILISIITLFLIDKNATMDKILLVSITGTLFWISGIYFLEFLHKQIDGRKKLVQNYYSVLPLVCLFIILLIIKPLSVFFIPLAIISTKLYSLKTHDSKISHLFFLFRPFVEITIILTIYFSYSDFYNVAQIIPYILAVYFLSLSRNLIGDIRDVDFDKYTLPKIIGVNKTYYLSFIFLLFAFVFLPNIIIQVPLIFTGLLILFKINSYALHRIFILTTTFFLAFYLSTITSEFYLILLLIFLSFILNYTYGITPRKSNVSKPAWL